MHLLSQNIQISADAPATSASNPPIWLQVGSPRPRLKRSCARSQRGRDCCNFCRPEGVRRRRRCRRSFPECTPTHPRFFKGPSMRVNVVVSSACDLPNFPCVVSPVICNAMSKVYCVNSNPVARSSRLYILVTARAARRRLAQAHGSTGNVLFGSRRRPRFHNICIYIFWRNVKINSNLETRPQCPLSFSRRAEFRHAIGCFRFAPEMP